MTQRSAYSRLCRLLLGAALTMHLLAVLPAHAQQVASKTAEPKRFALVIGNAAYTSDNLPPLGSPCSADRDATSDTKLVASAFSAARWQVELHCNLSTADLRTKINAFNDRVLAEPRAFGVIYYSGHGAQVGGTNYLFGVDADIDEKTEASKYAQNSDALLFGGGAISIDEAMLKTRGLWGKGVVVIIDACRDNPLLKALRERKINTARYPAASLQIPNVVFAFATSAGQVAPDGGLGKTSRYASSLADAIKTHSGEDIEQVLSFASTKVIRDTHQDQVPGRIGELQRPPRFCVTGCASLLSQWQSARDTFGDANADNPRLRSLAPRSAVAPRVVTVRARLPQAAPEPTRLAPSDTSAPQETPAPESTPATPPTPATPAQLARTVAVDVLYCSGADTNAPFRKQRASRIHDNLAVFKTRASPVPGLVLGELRLQALAPAANQALYRASASTIYYSQDSPTLRTLASAISQASNPPLQLATRPGSAPSYLTIVTCDGVDVKQQTPTVYIQVALEQQRAGAQALRQDLQGALPAFRFANGIQYVERSPRKSEVRYFFPDHAVRAKELAKASATVLGHTVVTHYISGYETKLAGSTLLELWLGKTEAAPPVAGSPPRLALR